MSRPQNFYTPNYLRDSHMRPALRNGADALCEKPMVINPWNRDGNGLRFASWVAIGDDGMGLPASNESRSAGVEESA
jgi:hypothetical protein